jgi:oxygen-independent coproporphyrinogen III oxidase
MKFDSELLQKYNKPVPRYTSYPPANHFREDFTAAEAMRLINTSNRGEPKHLAFYVHIPFCEKLCFYCGCNACSIGNGKQVKPYIEALKKEIAMVVKMIDPERRISQIHYGGGTPNAIPAEMISQINNLLYTNFDFIEKPEIAIECNPAYLDKTYIDALKAAGFNRFSLGIQDFDIKVLKEVNRLPSAMPVDELIAEIKSGNSRISVNLDFIYGLPGQNTARFTETINKAIQIRPDRLVTFSYAHVPWIKANQKILEKRGLPSAAEKMEMFLASGALLQQHGYQPIGLDHYVLKDDELYKSLEVNMLHRNFQGYCTRRTTGQVYAFGVSAISQLDGGYIQNVKETGDYIQMINRGELPVEKGLELTKDQKIIREAINNLMCNLQLNWKNLAGGLKIREEDLRRIIKPDKQAFNEFVKDGLIELTDENIQVTKTGTLYIRNIAAAIDPAYRQQNKKYSTTV